MRRIVDPMAFVNTDGVFVNLGTTEACAKIPRPAGLEAAAAIRDRCTPSPGSQEWRISDAPITPMGER